MVTERVLLGPPGGQLSRQKELGKDMSAVEVSLFGDTSRAGSLWNI